MLTLHLEHDCVHCFVGDLGYWMSKVVTEHHYHVFCSVNTSRIDCMVVGYIYQLCDIFPDVVLQHRHPVTTIEEIELSGS